MKKLWKKLLEVLFLYHKIEIKTSASKQEIQKSVELFVSENSSDYGAKMKENEILIFQKFITWNGFGTTKNSFAPVAVVKFEKNAESTLVSVLFRMNRVVQILFVPLWIILLASALLIFDVEWVLSVLFILVFLFFGFYRPVKRLKKEVISFLGTEIK